MFIKFTRLRFRRGFKRTRKNVEDAQEQAVAHLEKHVVKRWQKFNDVRRFIFSWLILILVLSLGVFMQTQALQKYYVEQVPIPGGIYTEGVVGKITNLNPIFATTETDRSIATLVFDPLVRYDQNAQITPALAADWKVNKEANQYTIKLRNDIKWHDGTAITTQDVVFTIETIQHPDTSSQLNRSWRDVAVTVQDDQTIVFDLPNQFTPFMHSLTRVGILPHHILGEIQPKELRANEFNLNPTVGSGPYAFVRLSSEDQNCRVRLSSNEQYYRGQPNIEEVIIESFEDNEQLAIAFNNGLITGAAGLRVNDIKLLNEGHQSLIDTPTLYSNVFLFFKNTDSVLKDVKLRKALAMATDTKRIFSVLESEYPISQSPLFPEQIGYSQKLLQPKYNVEAAKKALTNLGWKLAEDGLRYKGDQKLELSLVTQNTDEYPAVAEEIQRQWYSLGVSIKLDVLEPAKLQQDKVLPHNYQMILMGVDQGVDPDVFAFWHSSQANIGSYNLSEYKNEFADIALEAGRTRTSEKLRAAKYTTFLTEWIKDVPAIALYRPVYFYGNIKSVQNCDLVRLADPVDRFFNIHQWTIRTEQVKTQI